nr:hypothetical protein [uncultured Desulfuromonas sp.]
MIASITTPTLDSFKAEARQLLEAAVKQRQEQQGPEPQSRIEDKVSLGNKPAEKVTYTAEVSDADLGKTFTMLRDLFATTLQEQGIALEVATENSTIDLQSLTPEQAKELVSEDGYFGIEKTAQRIFDFAVGLSGNDPSRIDAIRAGIEDGFAKAEEAWGGTLPDISYETKEVLMNKLEDWVNADSASGEISEAQ